VAQCYNVAVEVCPFLSVLCQVKVIAARAVCRQQKQPQARCTSKQQPQAREGSKCVTAST